MVCCTMIVFIIFSISLPSSFCRAIVWNVNVKTLISNLSCESDYEITIWEVVAARLLLIIDKISMLLLKYDRDPPSRCITTFRKVRADQRNIVVQTFCLLYFFTVIKRKLLLSEEREKTNCCNCDSNITRDSGWGHGLMKKHYFNTFKTLRGHHETFYTWCYSVVFVIRP